MQGRGWVLIGGEIGGEEGLAQCRGEGRRQYAVKGDVTGEKERFLAMVGAVTSEISLVRTGAFKINSSAPLARGARGGAGGRGW